MLQKYLIIFSFETKQSKMIFRKGLVIGLLFIYNIVLAQVPAKVEVLGARTFEYDQKLTGKVKKLIGDVRLKQDQTLLFCDSAYLYEETNFVEAFGHIHIQTNDTIHVYGDALKYDGNHKRAKVERNVRMNDNNMRLTSNELDYDMINNSIYYSSGGKITNQNSTLVSKYGSYNTLTKMFSFKRDVLLTTTDYVIKSDTLRQHTTSNMTYFIGPSTITNSEDTIYCENGWYDNNRDLAMFSKNARISNKDRILYGDSLFYNRKDQYGKGYTNIKLIDLVNKLEIHGDFGEFIGKRKQSYITKRAYAKKYLEKDSMYLVADTIYSFQQDKIKGQKQVVKAYSHAMILKLDLQSACDSLVYDYSDSTIQLYKQPVMWSGQNQITSDTIVLFINNNKLDSFHLKTNAFVISRESKRDFNQIKGKSMVGLFEDSKFKYIHVYGNGQSIFYAKDEKDSSFLGVNVIDCSEMEFFLANNKMMKSNFITAPEAVFYPMGQLKPEELRLKGFKWMSERRPGPKTLLRLVIKN
jgi:lipopolysaccharide export system protein LptA